MQNWLSSIRLPVHIHSSAGVREADEFGSKSEGMKEKKRLTEQNTGMKGLRTLIFLS